MNTEQRAADVRRVDDAMTKVRGRAQETRGLVAVETDAYGTITELFISPDALKADAARLAAVISRCHREAREDAEAEAARLLTQLSDSGRPAAPAHTATDLDRWEEDAPLRIIDRM
ncbi:YbaB/EbfC family nucleoid-associated protein [Nocardia sp. NPDC055321]